MTHERAASAARHQPPHRRGPDQRVIEVTLVFRYPWKEVARGRMIEMHRAIARKITPGKESTHMVSLLVNTEETAAQLMKRIRDRTMEACPIESMWAQEIGANATGFEPAFDPFAFRVLAACNEARDRNEAQDLGQRRTRDGRVKDCVQKLDRGAEFDVSFRLPGERQSVRDTDRDKS